MRAVSGFVLMLMLAGAVWAAGEPVLTLSPKLRAALVAEMAGLKEGTAELAAALATGDWARTSQRALKMRDSYILKQKLTRAELAELEHVLPRDFGEMDARFHQHAEALAHAAERRDTELSGFYFSRMLDGCMSCHARYAAHALPGFAAPAPAPAHAH
jgi:hypothetical protein